MSDEPEAVPATKPGYKSTEFYATGATGAAIVESGILEDPTPWVRAAGVLGLAVIAVGYAIVRTRAKAS